MYEVNGLLYTVNPIEVDGVQIEAIVNAGDLSPLSRERMKELIENMTLIYENKSDEEIGRIIETRKQEQYDVWVERNEEGLGTARRGKKTKIPAKRGYVYVIKEHFSSTHKIGLTRNIKDRSSTFGVTLPFEWDFVHIFESNDIVELEKALHRKFHNKRVNGEWFKLSEGDLLFLDKEIFEDAIYTNLIEGVVS